jgi:hypothetical protein
MMKEMTLLNDIKVSLEKENKKMNNIIKES